MADSVLSLGTATGGGSIAVDSLGGTLYPYGKIVHGGAGTATPVTAVNPLPVNGTVTPAGGAITPSDSLANPTTHGAVVSHGLRYDAQAGTWFRDSPGRELAASDVLASASRTATASSPALSTRGARGLAIRLNVTAVPGTGGDLTLRYLYIFAAGTSVAAGGSGLTITRTLGANAWYLIDYPGASAVSSTRFLQRSMPALPPRISIQVVHSDSESWTYSVEADLLP